MNKPEELSIEVGPHWTITSIPNGGVPGKQNSLTGREWTHQTPIIETLVTPKILRTYWGFSGETIATDGTGNRLFESVFRRYCGDPSNRETIARQDQKEEGTWSKGYASVREIRPGELLYVYGICHAPQDWRGGPLPTATSCLWSRYRHATASWRPS